MFFDSGDVGRGLMADRTGSKASTRMLRRRMLLRWQKLLALLHHRFTDMGRKGKSDGGGWQ